MDPEGINSGRFDDNDETLGNDGEEENQFMAAPWGRQEGGTTSPTNSAFQAEEVSNDDSHAKLGEEGGGSQEGNATVNEYSGGDGVGTEVTGAQYPESSGPDKDGNGEAEDIGFIPSYDDDGDGTVEEQQAFVATLEKFFRDRKLEYKPPKFYGEELNCLKLWKAVMRLGGYEHVTSGKLWRQVGDSFKPPKTCTTISWSFRGFYEKALLDFERFVTGCSYQEEDPSSRPEDGSPAIQPPGRARRDAAARAMQGWHSQRMGNGDLAEPLYKDKSSKHKRVNKPNFLKRKDGKGKYNSFDDVSPAKKRTSTIKTKNTTGLQSGLELDVIDEGPQADWVKINVHQTRDCFEVYALVPGLLREEVRIQCEVGGRLVIAGEPEQPDNPWGVTAFRKVINLPLKIDAHQTSAVVTLHGQLFIRVPFAQSAEKGS